MKMSEKQRNFERLSESQNCCTRPVLKNCKKKKKKGSLDTKYKEMRGNRLFPQISKFCKQKK